MAKPNPKSFVKHALNDSDLMQSFIDLVSDQIDEFKERGGHMAALRLEVVKSRWKIRKLLL